MAGLAVMAPHAQRVPTKGKDGNPAPIPMEVVLMREGLEAYAPYFVHIGHHLFETHVRRTSDEVEGILVHVEKAHEDEVGYPIPLHDRIQLWKTIMYSWHRSLSGNKRFIEKHEVEKLFLPKRDFRMMDSEVKIQQVDPDRQRQIVRRRVAALAGGADGAEGPQSRREQQFEVYKRQDDVVYILDDLKRCVEEWQRMNPRKMLKEDPREEVMKMRVQRAMELFDAMLHERKALRTQKMRVTHALLATRLFFLFSAVLMYLIAYGKYWSSPDNPGISRSVKLSFIISSRQVVSGTSFLVAACVAYVVSQRRKADPMIRQLHSMVISCERFMEEIADFRVESEEIRMESKFDDSNTMAARLQQVRSRKAGVKVRQRRRRKRREEEVEGPPDALKAWGASPDMLRGGPDWHGIIRGIETSFQKLPPLPDDFQRPGGDTGGNRNLKHLHRLGGDVDMTVRHVKVKGPPPVPPPGMAHDALAQGSTRLPLELCPPVPPPALPPDGALFAECVTPDQTQVDLTLGSMGLTPPVPPEPESAEDPAGLRHAGDASGDLLPPAGLREAGKAHVSTREGPLTAPAAAEVPAQPPPSKPGPSAFLPEDASGFGNFEPSATGLLGAMHASFSVGASLPSHLRAPPAPPSSSSFSGLGEFTAGFSATEVGECSGMEAGASLESVDEFGVPGLSDAELSSDAAHASQAQRSPRPPVDRTDASGNPAVSLPHGPNLQGDICSADVRHTSTNVAGSSAVPLPPRPNLSGDNISADGMHASADTAGDPTVPLPPGPDLQGESLSAIGMHASAGTAGDPTVPLPPGPNLQGESVSADGMHASTDVAGPPPHLLGSSIGADGQHASAAEAGHAPVPPMPPLPGTPRADDGSDW